MNVRACRMAVGVFGAMVLTLAQTTPAFSYRVFLDADTDGSPYTFRNLVEGPATTPVDFIVVMDDGDAALTDVHFYVSWDCADSTACLYGEPHGDIAWGALPDSFPFSAIDMNACTGLTCACTGARVFDALVDSPLPGSWVLGTLDFTRSGYGGPDCEPTVYGEVEFRVGCNGCSYQPGDDPFTRLVLRDPAVGSGEGPGSDTWGRTKALYR